MELLRLSLLAAFSINIAYGLLVYLTNPRRLQNLQFLSLSLAIALWMGCVWFALRAGTPAQGAFWIRLANASGFLPVVGFALLRLSIKHPSDTWLRNVARARIYLLAALLMFLLCETRFFISHVTIPEAGSSGPSIAEPVYGPGFAVYMFIYAAMLGRLVWMFVVDTRNARGMAHVELQFVFLACGASVLTATLLCVVLPAITGSSRTAPLGPVGAVVMNAIIAYGIATHRIMGVAAVLRRLTAYALTAAYLCALYFLVQNAARGLLEKMFQNPGGDWPHLVAALTVAFSLAPAQGWMQRLATRLFVNVARVDVARVVQDAGRALQSIGTLDEQLKLFSDIVARSLGTDRPVILLEDAGGSFRQAYPEAAGQTAQPLTIDKDDSLVAALRTADTPLAMETITRRRMPPALERAAERLTELKVSVASSIRRKDRLTGIMLLGPRLSGRIYGGLEQDAVQTLSNQMAVSIENAKLYTEAENSRIYNDILLDNLVSGVVAAGTDRIVTVFNREAQRITRIRPGEVIGRDMSRLPKTLQQVINETLDTGHAYQEEEMSIDLDGEEYVFVRLGSSVFKNLAGETLGALLVFHDVTSLKTLQEQIRRSDRLASMGTLSAGMAHEIKNPLVTIKTFTQLLPERFEDPEFREDFTELVSEEVKRIDGIVSQLLTFARPSKPSFSEIHMHEVLENSLRLVTQEFHRKNVEIVRDFGAAQDMIMGDPDLLGQAFVNFLLNSQEAMVDGGLLTLSTSVRDVRAAEGNHRARVSARPSIRISIEDTGVGIRTEDLARIFDPFFTTKSQGTGLGLAVAHGIIEEQGGVIDVRSEPGHGTTIAITFPLILKEKFA